MTDPDRIRMTIAIPTLNREHCVGRAIESALAQPQRGVEIIVSNNGSTDGTKKVLARYTDPRLRVVHHDRTIPASAHGNFLVDLARGELFVGLSDDDYLEPDFFRSVSEIFDERPGLAFAYTGCLVHYSDIIVPSKLGPRFERGIDFLEAFYGGQREVCWCGCASRTADLRFVGPLPERRICGDMYYWTRLAFLGDIGCVQRRLAHYTLIGDNTSSGAPVVEWTREARATADEVLARVELDSAHAGRGGQMQRRMKRFLARTCANQFAWNAMRGARRPEMLRALPYAAPYLLGDPRVWPRVAAAFALPSTWIRTAILFQARRQSRSLGLG